MATKSKLATIELELVGSTKGYLKFKEESQENTVGIFYFARAMFDGKEPEKITVTVGELE